MRTLGLSFQKGRMRVTIMDSDDGVVSYHTGRAINIDPELSIPDLMERYATQMRALVDEFSPQLIASKQVWESKNVAASLCQVTPIGIAGLISHEKGLAFASYTPQALRQAKPFGLPKGSNPIEAIDGQFGSHPPYWDDIQKASLLVAWRALLENT
jgi:hypothetical protein